MKNNFKWKLFLHITSIPACSVVGKNFTFHETEWSKTILGPTKEKSSSWHQDSFLAGASWWRGAQASSFQAALHPLEELAETQPLQGRQLAQPWAVEVQLGQLAEPSPVEVRLGQLAKTGLAAVRLANTWWQLVPLQFLPLLGSQEAPSCQHWCPKYAAIAPELHPGNLVVMQKKPCKTKYTQ